jgi:hypothetical protein
MSSAGSFEELSTSIATLNKSEVKMRLKSFKGVKLDFTERYLDGQSTDKLRHILLAALTTKRRRH